MAGEGQIEKDKRLEEKLRRELGETIVGLLDSGTELEDIALNADGKLWAKRSDKPYELVGSMRESNALSAMGTIASMRGTVINHNHAILETEMPIWGARFEGLVPPVVPGPVFAVRQRASKVYTLEDYARAKILTHKEDPRNRTRQQEQFIDRVQGKSHLEVVREAIVDRQNILVAGATGAGKTTFLNAVLHGIGELTPSDRVVVIEDTPELQINCENQVTLLASGEVSMLDCLRATMRLRPKRIVVGEVRGKEALVMIKAWNTGHPGGAATVHANDAYSALVRLEALVAEATEAPQQRLIAEAVDLVASVASDQDGRKVRQIAVVKGYEDGHYLLEAV